MHVMALHPSASVEGADDRFAALATSDYLPPRTDPVEELMFMTWDSRLLGEHGEVVGYVLEKIPASFNPSRD
jgi:hypothetical protein